MEFDTSDVPQLVPPNRPRAVTEPIPIDEEDMIEPACVLPLRTARGTTPPAARFRIPDTSSADPTIRSR
jgi:hypothetical protein